MRVKSIPATSLTAHWTSFGFDAGDEDREGLGPAISHIFLIEAPLPQGRLTPSPHRMRRLRIPNSSSKLVMTLNVSHQRLNSPKALIPVLPTVCTTLRTFDCLETQLEPYISKEPFKFSGMSLKRTISLYNKLSNITSLEALAAIHPPPQGQVGSSDSPMGVFSPQTSIKARYRRQP